MNMLMLKNATHCIFFYLGSMTEAKAYRKAHPAFKGRHIKEVLQFCDVEMGVEFEINGG